MNRFYIVTATIALFFSVTFATAQSVDRLDNDALPVMPDDKTLLNDIDVSIGVPVGNSDKWIGVLCRLADPVLRNHLQLADGVGLVVEQVVPDSPAATAGVQAGDILTHLDGEPLTSLDQLMAKTAAAGEGGIRLSWIRDGKVHMDAATVHPQPRPHGAAAFRVKRDATSMPDANRLREWVDKLQGGQFMDEGGKPLQFRFFGPGVKLQPGQNVPMQLSLEIQRQNDEPAKIKVTKDGTTWDLTENDLDQLPEDVRGAVQNALGRGGAQGFLIQPDRIPWPNMDERFEEMNRRMEKMFEELHELREHRQNEADEPMDA